MERIKIAQIFADQERFGGKEVLVSGWARTIRDMKTFGFVELNDGSCFKNLQIVLDGAGPAGHQHLFPAEPLLVGKDLCNFYAFHWSLPLFLKIKYQWVVVCLLYTSKFSALSWPETVRLAGLPKKSWL